MVVVSPVTGYDMMQEHIKHYTLGYPSRVLGAPEARAHFMKLFHIAEPRRLEFHMIFFSLYFSMNLA
jgi:hypothetical protein